ncbi:MAG: prepilin peptidase [Oscillospiraceae bacterium]|nr:prepilin peptidase [Oscillospiraceae bacterium]
MNIIAYIILAVLGLCVGSFCNVLIFRLPKGEEFIKTPSHCMACGHKLNWYENIPLISWLIQGGKCRSCAEKISAQYPIIEAINTGAWLLTGALFGEDLLKTVLYCALFSLLTVIAVIDWRTFEIPNGLNLAIFILGVIRLATDLGNLKLYLIGMLCVSLFFLIIWFVTGGAGIGMGDVKLMGAAGLLIGWKNIVLGLFVGCIIGAVIHIIRMKRGAGRRLAFGPYLAAGIWLAALFGSEAIAWYIGLFGF